MIWLVLGVALWWLSHTFKRFAPEMRARMGDAGKGLVAITSVIAIVLMVIGYQNAETTPLWQFGKWAVMVNNLLMLLAVGLFALGHSKSRLRGKIRHPMLTSLVVWAIAHLLVNGDLESLVLFGGLGIWALADMALINRSEPAPEPYTGGSVAGDIRLVIITLVVTAIIMAVHAYLGVRPYP